jgi:hypothetical protein
MHGVDRQEAPCPYLNGGTLPCVDLLAIVDYISQAARALPQTGISRLITYACALC